MVEQPIEMAQSQEREIAVPGPGEERISEAFRDEWERICADGIILNAMATARAYGVSTLALMIEGTEPSTPVDWKKLADLTISFSVFDPLNTAGSIVLNQDPLAMDFQKVTAVSVSGMELPLCGNHYPANLPLTYPGCQRTTPDGFGKEIAQINLFPIIKNGVLSFIDVGKQQI